MKSRSTIAACAALSAAALVFGCGDAGDSSNSSDLASLAPPKSLVFVEGTIRPTGETKANIDAIAGKVGDIDNLGDFLVEEFEDGARGDGEPVDFATDIEPWLGDRAGIAFEKLDEDGDLSDPLIAVQSTDAAAAQAFVDEISKDSEEPYGDGSYEGVDYVVGGAEDDAVGVIDDLLVIAEDRRSFERAVDAAEGESLADVDRYVKAISAASEASVADVYVDVGGVIEQSEDGIDDQAQQILESAGIDPSDATAVASVLPGTGRVEIELSSDLGGEEAPSGDASELLGSVPADSFAAFAVSGFGKQLEEAIDSLDESGIPGEIPPGQLKNGLGAAGIDLDRISASLGDAAVFAQGNTESRLGGALVLSSDESGEAEDAVAGLGSLLRAADTPGVTAVTGEASGFSIRDEELGDKPLVVVAKGDRIAIGYGLAPALEGVASPGGATLAGTSAYKEAVAALGDTPISAFAAGPAALRLADALISSSDTDFEAAKPYLGKISSLALGSGTDGDLATARLIVSLK